VVSISSLEEAGFETRLIVAVGCLLRRGRGTLSVRSGAWLSGRAFASHARGRWFDSTRAHHFVKFHSGLMRAIQERAALWYSSK
jgi:hypothetical protein